MTETDTRLIAGLRQEVVRLTAERDALRAQVSPGYRVVQHPTKPIFLAADIADAHVDEEQDLD